MVRRFGRPDLPGLHVLDAPAFHDVDEWTARDVPYPFGWVPTFHKYRLDVGSPRKPGRVFVCPMADLWGSWVPPEWQDEVLFACGREPHHDYLFLTKNQAGYNTYNWQTWSERPWAWLGISATDDKLAWEAAWAFGALGKGVRFLSLEPWLGGDVGLAAIIRLRSHMHFNWAILGPLTGTKSRTAPPVSADMVRLFVDVMTKSGRSVYVKPSATAWGLTPEEIATMQAFPRPHPSER
jgi:protein gp37